MTALVEGSSEDDDDAAEDQDEARKAAVREMLKSQSMNDLRFNSKHTVSQVNFFFNKISDRWYLGACQ